MNTVDRPVKFCPWCGGKSVVENPHGLLRCSQCRVVFFVSYSRQMRNRRAGGRKKT